jgi:hypothetical protein
VDTYLEAALAAYRERTGDTTDVYDMTVNTFLAILGEARQLKRAQECNVSY